MSSQKDVFFKHNARYFVNGSLQNVKKIWFVLHGYGQLAEYFIRKFSLISDQEGIIVIAPEGLSRFYLEGFSGRVGATWMTREDRQRDIENYVNYLNAVFDEVTTNIKLEEVEITILGFSQGAATATRWVLNKRIKFDRLILWAGVFPDDMDLDASNNLFFNKSVKLVVGDQDPFITEDRLNKFDRLLDKQVFKLERIVFKGAHDIHAETLLKLV